MRSMAARVGVAAQGQQDLELLDRLQDEQRVIRGVLDAVDRALVNYISDAYAASSTTSGCAALRCRE